MSANKKSKQRKRVSRPIDRLIGRYAAQIRAAGSRPHANVYEFKTYVSPVDQFRAHKTLFPNQDSLDAIYGPAFPQSVSQMFGKHALYAASPVLNEIVWAISRVLSHRDRIKQFISFREIFEQKVLANNRTESELCLLEIERVLGKSLWLLQNKLSTVFLWQGLDEMRKLVHIFSDEAGSGSFLTFLLPFLAMRTESAERKEAQRNKLDQEIKRYELVDEELKQYLSVKLFGFHDISMRDAGALLLFEAQSSLIDHYEGLLSVIQSAVTNRAITPEAVGILEAPLLVLHKAVRDRRLVGIMRALGFHTDELVSQDRADVVEAYTAGRYAEVIGLSEKYLAAIPDDMAVFVLRIRACVRCGQVPAQNDGVLSGVSSNLFELFKASSAAYQSAFAVLTLADRFYSQSWMHYIRAIVLHELETVEIDFPSKGLRRIYLLDSWLSPFSAIAVIPKISTMKVQEREIGELYPLTAATYAAASTGKLPSIVEIAPGRMRKYLARYSLCTGDYSTARIHYEWLLENTKDDEKLRASGGAALTYMKLGMFRKAATTLVDAYLENSSLPSVLPIDAIASSLAEPASWGNAITMPLLFELHTSYCSENGIARLRYSFEKFLTDNGIEEPENLTAFIPNAGSAAVVAFLDRVWRPEVMRQTLLYSGTKDIEDARIKACKVLALIHPQKEGTYLEEVKERVKQLEIAKGTTLIEQSKVHVDIDAIKRSLRKNLGDSYARYKSSSLSSTPTIDNFVLDIAEVIAKSPGADKRSLPRLLSSLHMLDSVALSESDVQFDAIFSEVTNEFLFGNHGLNAYLSTCVRHGTLSNILRKPVADEGIVTARQSSGAYLRNTRWADYAGSGAGDLWKKILDALDTFSREFDSIVDHVKDDLLQIRVMSGRSAPKENQHALFVYATSNMERKYVQYFDRGNANMDDFVSYCVNTLWDKTDDNLLVVQKVLNQDIRSRLTSAFDTLENAIRPMEWLTGARDLINAIARARTATQQRLTTVSSWFKRSEVYDRLDYVADFPAHIALNMIKSTISSAANWRTVNIERTGDNSPMPGRTLDAMVYIFYDLFANALVRSGLSAEQLSLSVEISFVEGRFKATVTNNVDASRVTNDERERVRMHRESIFKSDSPGRAQSEKNSGLHKVWIALNAPVYVEPSLHFDLLDTSFVVEIVFKVNEGAHEDSLH